jgi:RNA polymerase sigma factor (sigma-70 family)
MTPPNEDARMSDGQGQDWLHAVLQEFEQPLIGYGMRLLGDAEAARDVTQDTFLALCRHRLEPDDPKLGPWLYRVLRHRAIDRLRKERRMHRLESADTEPTPEIPPALAAERQDDVRRLTTALEALPPRQQEVVWLRFRSGLSYREIAEVTNTTAGSVGALLHAALRRLRERLGEADWDSATGEM